VVSDALILGVSASLAVAIFLIAFYWYIYGKNRRLGTPGIRSRSILTCPKCHETFDYDYIPGASLTTVRLGAGRYMACPRCHKWSYFDLLNTRVARTESASDSR
jgi:hypothetical protein